MSEEAMRRLEVAGVVARDGEDARIVAPPGSPMAVARELVDNLYTGAGALLLRDHRGDFYHHDGTCWPEIEPRAVRGAVYRWLEHAAFVKDDKMVPWDPTRRKINDVIDALRAVVHLDGHVEPPAWIDRASEIPADEIVPVANGLLHVPTRRLLPHTPHLWAHNALPFDYDPSAPRPHRWLDFLSELWSDDTDSISTLQEIVGYMIGGDTRQQKIVLMVGPKRSGKGTIGRVITGLLGKHNVASPTLAGLSTNFGLSPLIGRPLGLISDARLSSKADAHVVVERLLSVSGEDSITIDRKYRDPWTGRLPTRFLILTNELPRLTDSSGALASRFVMLVLTKTFYGRENPALTEELLGEATGILNWGLEGLDRLTDRGHFVQPEAGAEAIRQLEDLASPVAAFVRERCETRSNNSVPVDSLWSAWKDFCEDENRHPGTKANFGRDLRATAPTVRKRRLGNTERVHVYAGIALLDTTLPRRGDGHDGDHSRHSSHGDEPMYVPQSEGTSRNGFGTSLAKCSECGRATYYFDIDGDPKCPRHKDSAKQGQAS